MDPRPQDPPRGPAPLPVELAPLAGTPGLDPAAGLRQCGNRAPMYRHMLIRFTELYAEPLPGPAAADGTVDTGLRDKAHSLRGASATVGAVQVQALAAALESLCDDANAAPGRRAQAHAALCDALHELTGQLRRRLGGPAAPDRA